ncbi:MAG: 2-keto-3-deoxy-D-arabinonate dehydratase, partial [Acidobacteriota bacterium]|nr:2-keto-3-deoxy-D-arabinonate dehydratase [Acidobacteriota bacterium]
MHLGQIRHDGAVIAAIFEGAPSSSGAMTARPIPAHTVCDLINRADSEGIPLNELAASLASRHPVETAPLIPISPVEVWASGCTYETSATFRDGE